MVESNGGHSAPVPSQQGVWRHEPARSLSSRQDRRDGTQQGPVLIGDGWSVALAVQHCELVAQHDDLKILRASRAHSQACQRHEQPVQNATHRTSGCKRIMPGQRTRPNIGHPHGRLVTGRGYCSGRKLARRNPPDASPAKTHLLPWRSTLAIPQPSSAPRGMVAPPWGVESGPQRVRAGQSMSLIGDASINCE